MLGIQSKRLCVILPSHWAANFGGAEFQVRCLLHELEKHGGFEVFYLARNLSPQFTPHGYEILSVGNNIPLFRNVFLFDAPLLLSTLREIRPDIIYQRVGCSYTGIAAHYAKKFSCRMVWHIANTLDVAPFKMAFSRNMIFDYLEKRILEYGIHNADCIIAQTKEQADLLAMNYNRSPAAIISNFHPVPQESIAKSKEVTVVWIANFKPVKRPELFIRLAEDLGHLSETRFIMLGRSNNGRWSKSIMRRMENIKNLEYPGEQSHENINKILEKADILVNTSEFEGFPNTFIQAWMREVPVVSLDVNPDNVLSMHNTGFYSSTYKQMVEDTKKLIIDKELRQKMGKDARNYALLHHSEKNAAQIVQILSGSTKEYPHLQPLSN